jgi:hypothetical protein
VKNDQTKEPRDDNLVRKLRHISHVRSFDQNVTLFIYKEALSLMGFRKLISETSDP